MRAFLAATSVAAFAVFGATPAVAESATPTPLLAAACANCHGPEGRGAWPIAAIAGRPYSDLLRQLESYRINDSIDDATVMPRLMAGYSKAEVEALARWFSSLPAALEAAP
jgi:cytochrome c553